MFTSLHKYLILHKKLNIPGIGCFAIEQTPVHFDYANRQFNPPVPVIRFSLESATADKHFFDFLSSDLSIEGVEAIRRFNDLSFNLKEDLNHKDTAELPGIGQLKKEFSNTWSFQPSYNVNEYFPPLNAEYVIRKDAEHTIRVGEDERTNTEMKTMLGTKEVPKDKWFVWAVLLAAAGIAALIFHRLFM